jgi:Flp pilus assembly protein TadB
MFRGGRRRGGLKRASLTRDSFGNWSQTTTSFVVGCALLLVAFLVALSGTFTFAATVSVLVADVTFYLVAARRPRRIHLLGRPFALWRPT